MLNVLISKNREYIEIPMCDIKTRFLRTGNIRSHVVNISYIDTRTILPAFAILLKLEEEYIK